MSCSRTQHGGGRYRTPGLSLRSPTLYHWATAPPKTLIRLGGCPGWSDSLLGAQSFCWFCREAALYLVKMLTVHPRPKLKSHLNQQIWDCLPRIAVVSVSDKATLEAALEFIKDNKGCTGKTIATTWQNQQNACTPSEDSGQPGHPPSLIRVFAVHSVGS